MELVEGLGLEQRVNPGGLPVERVKELGIAVANALAELAGHREYAARVHYRPVPGGCGEPLRATGVAASGSRAPRRPYPTRGAAR